MNSNDINEKCKNLLLKLHLKYIVGISFACVCLVIVLSFCEDSVFKNCISVSSTVTSIILSVIAIILSVTGERTTNEIRNKVSDSVEKLEDCTDKSSKLSIELSKTLQQLNSLYGNINDKIVEQIPEIKESLNSLLTQNTENNDYGTKVINSIVNFLSHISPDTKLCVKKAFIYLQESVESKAISPGDIAQWLIDEGADATTGTIAVGLFIGYLSTGTLDSDAINEIIARL